MISGTVLTEMAGIEKLNDINFTDVQKDSGSHTIKSDTQLILYLM